MTVKERIDHLRDEIHQHNRKYYIDNAPVISDKEFDRLLKELETLESEHPEYYDPLSPTQRVGSDLTTGFVHVFHERPMMSLSNTYSIQDVDDWFHRMKKAFGTAEVEVVGEMKFDGTSISITYRDGMLAQAVTRGDGLQGDDVTANVKAIRSIPLKLAPGDWPQEFEIRGEILMPWESFERLNKERAANDEPLFANPRNAASGTLKMLSPSEVSRRRLDARFYTILGKDLPADNHLGCMEAARKWGFNVSPEMTLLHDLEEVDRFIVYWDEHRKFLPVATDGLVFKVNSFKWQVNLGATAKSPRWAVAYKFNPERECTPLRFVSFETGRMGIVTPVANLEPVQLSGTIVKRASLHNKDILRELDIYPGDWLYVEKSGEIIPQIVGVDKSRRAASTEPVVFPTRCPECGAELYCIEGESAMRCPNIYGCRPQITGKIEHFCARRMMDIDGIGEETTELLFDCGLVKTPADLYDLTEEQLSGLDRIGPKTAARIIKGIEESKQRPFERLIYALSIPNVGETTSRRIAVNVKSMDKLMSMDQEQLAGIEDVGPIIAKGVYDFFRNDANRMIIDRLREAGVRMQCSENGMSPASDELHGEVIVVSGVFARHSRDEYKQLIESHGGRNASSISKATSFVLAGENMGPAKRKKCEALGIPILSEDEFLRRIDNPD